MSVGGACGRRQLFSLTVARGYRSCQKRNACILGPPPLLPRVPAHAEIEWRRGNMTETVTCQPLAVS